MRVIHLLQSSGPETSPTALAAMADATAMMGDARVILIGGDGPRAQARDAGLAVDARFSAPGGRPLLAYPALVRWLERFEPVDLLHAWSPGAALLAALGRPGTRQVASLSRSSGLGNRATPVLAGSEGVARQLRARGIPGGWVRKCPPAADVSTRIAAHPREAVRRRWGISESTRVVAVLSDPPSAGDARTAALAASLANESSDAGESPPTRLLVHPDQRRLTAARRRHADLGRPPLTISDPAIRSPWRVLAGCDAVLCLSPDADGALLQWPLGAGLPVLAEAGSESAKRLEALAYGVVGGEQRLARALQRLHEGEAPEDVVGRAPTPAEAGFDPSRHQLALQDAYASLAAAPRRS